MIEVIVGMVTVLVGAVIYLLDQNKNLKSDKKLSDIKVEDATLKTKQEQLATSKSDLKKQLKELDKHVSEDLTDKEVEDFWKGYKK